MCSRTPIRHTGSPSLAAAIDECASSEASTIVIAPVPTTSSVVGADERGGVLVEADADRERVVGERGEQAAEAVALAEVLVDDEAVGEAEPGRQRDAAGARGAALLAERDHVLAQDGGAGAGAADGDAARVARRISLRDGRAAEDGREAELVAAGEEDAGGLARGAASAVASSAVGASIELAGTVTRATRQARGTALS